MNRGDAYTILASRLSELRAEGYAALLPRVDQPAASETVWLNGESIVVDVQISWADHKSGKLRVWASALGPSTWTMERLDESFVVGPS